MIRLEATFNDGDVIVWCDEQYTVLSNYGHKGKVQDGSGQIIDPFYWIFGGIQAKRILEDVKKN